MTTPEIYASLGLPADAEIASCAGRLISITPPQPKWLTAIVAAGLAGEFDVEDPVRAVRDRLLTLSDWTQAADAPVDRTAWATYRQALRDLPSVYSGEGPIPWPQEPA
jgi:hypothetical protein